MQIETESVVSLSELFETGDHQRIVEVYYNFAEIEFQ